MKSAHFRELSQQPILKTLIALFFVIVLAACRASDVSKLASTSTPLPQNSTIPSNLDLNPATLSVKVEDLLIQSTYGLGCPSSGGTTAQGQLVLASSRTTYSQDEIAQMRTYITGNSSFEIKADSRVKPPSTLRWILGAPTSPIPATMGMNCNAVFNLTNTGTTSIQIPKVGVQLQAQPQQNAYQYHLIDVCSFLARDANRLDTHCNPLLGGGGVCNSYFATIQLAAGEKSEVFSAVPRGINYTLPTQPDCGILTIAPSALVTLDVTFSLTKNTPTNLIYSALPIFTVITDQGEQPLLLSQLISTFAFASIDQFSCYELKGTKFVLEKSPDIDQNWCL